MSPDFSFTTARLHIREWTHADVPALLHISNNAAFGIFAGLQSGEQGAIDFVNKALAHQQAQTPDGKRASFRLAVTLKETGELIGYVGGWLFNPDPQLRKYGYELGVFMAADHRNMGYAFEASHGLMDVMRKDYGVSQFCATVDPNNNPSIRILEKSGFILEPTFDDEFLQHYYNRPRLLFLLKDR